MIPNDPKTVKTTIQSWENNYQLQAMKLKNQENSKNDQKPEFSKNPKIFKKQSISPENTGVPPVFSIVFWIFLDFLKIQVFDHFLNFLDFWVSWPVAGNYFLKPNGPSKYFYLVLLFSFFVFVRSCFVLSFIRSIVRTFVNQ